MEYSGYDVLIPCFQNIDTETQTDSHSSLSLFLPYIIIPHFWIVLVFWVLWPHKYWLWLSHIVFFDFISFLVQPSVFPWSGLCYFLQLSSFLWNYLLFISQPSARGVLFHNTIKRITQFISAFLFPGGCPSVCLWFPASVGPGWSLNLLNSDSRPCTIILIPLAFFKHASPHPSFFSPSFHFFYSIHIECHYVLGIVLGTVDRAELVIESWTG